MLFMIWIRIKYRKNNIKDIAKNEESKKKCKNIPIVSHAGKFRTVMLDGAEAKAI